MMTIQEISTRKEDQTFDCKSIQIDPKALAVPVVAFANAVSESISCSKIANTYRNSKLSKTFFHYK